MQNLARCQSRLYEPGRAKLQRKDCRFGHSKGQRNIPLIYETNVEHICESLDNEVPVRKDPRSYQRPYVQ
jgi:hypothetical protein